ncbi:MAG TPA: cyclic nucleotide-binding domain-containing protein [Myxococcaceae bacterium]|nr:cyclic nucleotide-binding domain-containing protein [Myxococcaceae bacterium]
MGELDPAVLAERMLWLRRTHPFEAFSPESLTLLAAAGREVVCSARTQLVSEGERASAHWVALTGRLHALRGGEPLSGDPIKDGAGGLSILTELAYPCDLVAEPGTVLFVLDADALLETLEEHGRLARAALRAMAQSVLDTRRREGRMEPAAVTVAAAKIRHRMDLVGRMLVLRSAVGLRTRNAGVLTRLARVARMETVPRGRSLWPDRTAPANLVVVTDGALDGRPDDEEAPRSGRGALYGLMEAVASVPRDSPVIATAESTALVVSQAEIQEALEDDDDRICLALIRLAALELWNDFWRRHPPSHPSVSQ